MKRGYTREQYIDKIAMLKAVRPDISISSDFIVGFPGESSEDFGFCPYDGVDRND